MEMYCRQCEQTAGGKACQTKGVCGKTPETAFWQDRLVLSLVGLAGYGEAAWEMGVRDREAECFVREGLFATVTNVNFDASRIKEMAVYGQRLKERMKQLVRKSRPEFQIRNSALAAVCDYQVSTDMEKEREQFGEKALLKMLGEDEDRRSLREILLYGLKGMAAYADPRGYPGVRR